MKDPTIKGAKIVILVAGSRSFKDYDFFADLMTKQLANAMEHDPEFEDGLKTGKIVFMSGDAKSGADAMIIQWCQEKDYDCIKMPAEWSNLDTEDPIKIVESKYGPYNALAGFNRNEKMARLCTRGIIFHDGSSPGTQDMIKRLEEKEINHVIILVKRS